ncbi:Phosphatidylinositol 3-kinase 60 [Operophtera brumata]|uniref:Phosphatidylinositol 3-kinase 60 n=1 Tax=Operophtera brumata TaxID=104452 RepID=A0A0L7KMZ5_OPEBR|nr:Phosphatidylinositol 3-kinase 60 [Operophtera brumata]
MLSERMVEIGLPQQSDESLESAEWDQATEKLRDTCDGTFLVRNASNKDSGYTLTVRKGGTNKLIKIYNHEGRYGFCEPFEFNSVVDLVSFYTHYSLAHCNSSLDIKLLYPLSRLQENEGGENISDDSLETKYKDIHKKYVFKTRDYDVRFYKYTRLREEVNLKRQALDAFKETVQVCVDHLKLQEKMQTEAQPHEKNMFMDNNRQLIAKALEDDNIHKLEELYAHRESKTWKVNCTRDKAEKILTGKPEGTFLIRPNSTGQLALSIVCNNMVYHCIIFKTERGFGFAEPYNVYETLNELVLHYAVNSLEEHNEQLTTTLKYPINGHLVKKP